MFTKDGKEFHGHMPLRVLPPELLEGRVGVATVRDPFSWMVSVYFRLVAFPPGKTRDFLKKWGGGTHRWDRVLYGWTHPGEIESPMERHAWANPWGSQTSGTEGLWSASVRWYHEGASVFIDTARQNEGWASLYPEHRDALIECGRTNEWDHPLVGDMFTPEQERWVQEADGDLMEALGYSGVGQPSTNMVSEFPVMR